MGGLLVKEATTTDSTPTCTMFLAMASFGRPLMTVSFYSRIVIRALVKVACCFQHETKHLNTAPMPPLNQPDTKLLTQLIQPATMAQHSGNTFDSKSSHGFLELLPPATYIPGTRRASLKATHRSRACSQSAVPTPEEVLAVITRSRSSSNSTLSSVTSSSDGDKTRFLQLVPETDE
ncbi:MAG: hypothetical protein Q9184_002833 [Pyrenodesmia sp. 2 TL-2023]